jgi:hypothetical protein
MKFGVITEQPNIFRREKLVRCLLIRIQDTKISYQLKMTHVEDCQHKFLIYTELCLRLVDCH